MVRDKGIHIFRVDMGRGPVFEISDKARPKPVSSATETSKKIEILHVASLDKRVTNALISLCSCTGWSVPLLLANPQSQVFSHRGPIMVVSKMNDANWD